MMASPLVNPPPTSASATKSMKGNVPKNTRPELELRRLLRQSGYGGYRLHWRVAGHPDIAYPSRHVAIFVNGCFWHRCPSCSPSVPKSNTEFWTEKFRRNVERDQRKCQQLADAGWTVVTVWECELRDEPSRVLQAVVQVLEQTAQG